MCQTAQITVLAELCDGTDVAVMLVPAVLLNRHLRDRPRPRSRVRRNHFGPGDLPRDAQLSGDVCMSASNTLIPKVLVLAYPKMVMPLSRSSPLELDSIGSDEGWRFQESSQLRNALMKATFHGNNELIKTRICALSSPPTHYNRHWLTQRELTTALSLPSNQLPWWINVTTLCRERT